MLAVRPSRLALAKQRLDSLLRAPQRFLDACLDDECAFYTGRAPGTRPLPSRTCPNPVALQLEAKDAAVSGAWSWDSTRGWWGRAGGGSQDPPQVELCWHQPLSLGLSVSPCSTSCPSARQALGPPPRCQLSAYHSRPSPLRVILGLEAQPLDYSRTVPQPPPVLLCEPRGQGPPLACGL